MPGSGTDKTKRWIEAPAPVVILVEPQLGENIGSAARAMANLGWDGSAWSSRGRIGPIRRRARWLRAQTVCSTKQSSMTP